MTTRIPRRRFLQHTAGALLAAAASAPLRLVAAARPPRVLLRSSWQTVNIGDIAHTPGMLALLARHLPEVEVRLWPGKVDNGVRELLLRRFPQLCIVEGAESLRAAFAECDFLLHGSWPSLVGQRDVARWRQANSFAASHACVTRPIG